MVSPMIDVIEYETDVAGPLLLITGAVHGQEPCGTIAIKRWIEKFNQDGAVLKKGCIRFIPCCNPKASEQKKRFIDVNLNRVMRHHDTPTCYEHHLANEIMPHIEWATHVVDLHSYVADDISFTFCERETPQMNDFVDLAYVDYVMLGFDDLLNARGLNDGEYDAVENTAIHMNKCASTIECGQNESPNSIEIADKTIHNYLVGLGMIDGDILSREKKKLRAFDIVYKKRAGRHVKVWRNFELVKKDQVIAIYDDGEEIKASDDGLIFLPRDKEVGSEWFHLARPL